MPQVFEESFFLFLGHPVHTKIVDMPHLEMAYTTDAGLGLLTNSPSPCRIRCKSDWRRTSPNITFDKIVKCIKTV